jgi:O-acetyl-ADP-ribose deacetylase (regulator of RNase III)
MNTIAERSYKKTTITIITGDITKLEVDAIVNPANSQLIMGGGVAGAILRTGGNEIQKQALKKAPVPIGKAVATTAGKLKAKHIIHAPTMTRPAMAATLEDIKAATKAALECAKQAHINSLAFPGLGTGVGGLNPQDASNAMAQEITKHIQQGTTIKQIILVGYNSDLASAFEKATRTLSQGEHESNPTHVETAVGKPTKKASNSDKL